MSSISFQTKDNISQNVARTFKLKQLAEEPSGYCLHGGRNCMAWQKALESLGLPRIDPPTGRALVLRHHTTDEHKML
eukprot:633099-Pelagomonas_calceolata.AAC.3